MDGHINVPFVGDREERASTPGNSAGSPFSGGSADGKISEASSPKRSRRAVKKRVVSVPISEAEGSRMKGEGAPPSDSWAWRKYGQKPIKGSPYPRGYYRCSSSKGCPARKQVERSRADPTMLLVTYACEHNHPGPTPRNAASSSAAPAAPTSPAPPPKPPADEPAVFSNPPEIELVETFRDLADDALFPDGFSWFSDVSSSPPSKEALLHSPICGGSHVDDAEVAAAAILFPMREEDESLFADLGELPECSVVFRRGLCERSGSMIAAPWCGSTG